MEGIVRNPYLNGEIIRLDGATRLSQEVSRQRRGTPKRSGPTRVAFAAAVDDAAPIESHE